MTEAIKKAKQVAIDSHNGVNATYGNGERPYGFHLEFTVAVLKFIRDTFPRLLSDEDWEIAIIVAYLHDIIEDTYHNYNSIRKLFGIHIAERVFLLTEEKGRNRDERHNQKYLVGISSDLVTKIVKLADILGNIINAKHSGSSMAKKYGEEFPRVRHQFKFGELPGDPKELNNLLDFIQAIIGLKEIPEYWKRVIQDIQKEYPITYNLQLKGFLSKDEAESFLAWFREAKSNATENAEWLMPTVLFAEV